MILIGDCRESPAKGSLLLTRCQFLFGKLFVKMKDLALPLLLPPSSLRCCGKDNFSRL